MFFNAYYMAAFVQSGERRGAGADERIEDDIARVGEKVDEPYREPMGKYGAVFTIATLRGAMQNIGWINPITAQPVLYFFSESTADFGFIAIAVGCR